MQIRNSLLLSHKITGLKSGKDLAHPLNASAQSNQFKTINLVFTLMHLRVPFIDGRRAFFAEVALAAVCI